MFDCTSRWLMLPGRKASFPRTLSLRCLPLGITSLLLALALLASPVQPARADAFKEKSDQFLQQQVAKNPASWVPVILQTSGPLQPEYTLILKAIGLDVYRRLPTINALAFRAPAWLLPYLAQLPVVDRLSEDLPVRKTDEFTVGSSGAGVVFAQSSLTGDGIGVAVVDSGVRDHPDLRDPLTGQSRVVAGVSFVPGDPNPVDENGHGTHVAGILAGNGAASTGGDCFRTFYGIAPKARVINVRVLDAEGNGTVSSVIEGLRWVVANRKRYGIRVLNLSLGHPVGEPAKKDPLCKAVEKAWKAGIVVVVAAGNSGRQQDTADPALDNEGYGTAYGSVESPGNSPYAITVGAMKSTDGVRGNDRIATYSSRGPALFDFTLKPDLVAPGNLVISTRCPGGALELTDGASNIVPTSEYRMGASSEASGYFRMSGTSMATPVVAGSAVLMLQADPTLSPDTVKTRLMLSADKWAFPDGSADACTFGSGYLNLPAALSCDVVARKSALSPALVRQADGSVELSFDGAKDLRAIWGTNVNDARAIWGCRAIWGKSTLSTSRAIWGKSFWVNPNTSVSSSAADVNVGGEQ